MKTSSAKAKGRRLAQKITNDLIELYDLPIEDIKVTPSGVTGPDIQLSRRATDCFPYNIECKNQETLGFWKAWEQVLAHNTKDSIPLLIAARNRQEPLVTMSWEHFKMLLLLIQLGSETVRGM